jgi:hypothetical protein
LYWKGMVEQVIHRYVPHNGYYRTMKDSEIWSLNCEVWSPKSEVWRYLSLSVYLWYQLSTFLR